MTNLFSELKRRNVLRVAASYVVISWLAIEVSSTLEETLALPAWFDTVVFAFLALGFPIAIVFSWAFELTPEGLKKTEDVDTDTSVTHHTAKRLDVVTLGALVVGIALLFARPYIAPVPTKQETAPNTAETQTAAASIAVLPFVDLSPEGDQEYFSDGISEEILNVLAKIPDLHVTSRSSAFAFKNKDVNIPDVASQLGVAHVLEGSVRKAGTTLRITAQLIEAESDKHLWSETYDRELDNIFQVQDDISAAIVDALKASLNIKGSAPLPQTSVKQTANPEAYTEYLLGQHAIHKRTRGDIETALEHFRKAVALDPNYAPAHVGVGLATYLLSDSPSTYGVRALNEALGDAQPAIDRALELNPNNSEALAVQGLFLNAQDKFNEATPYFEQAIALNPSNTDARVWYAQNLGDLNRREDKFQAYKDAYAIDPLAPLVLTNYINELTNRRLYDEARPVLERFKTIQPANAAFSEGFMLYAESRMADGVNVMLKAIAQNPQYFRLHTRASFAFANLGLREEALRMWPDDATKDQIILAVSSPQERLEIARSAFEEDPNNTQKHFALMNAYWTVRDFEKVKLMGNSLIERLPDDQRNSHFANWLLAVMDWRTGKAEAALKRIAPLESGLMQAIEQGAEGDIFIGAAVARTLRDDPDSAKDYLRRYAQSGTVDAQGLTEVLAGLGVADDPEYSVYVDQIAAFRDQQRDKLLTRACGTPGYTAWKPLPATCAQHGF